MGLDGEEVHRTKSFALPIQKRRDGSYKLQPTSELFTCGTSDFFIEEADEWRAGAWEFIKERQDIRFLILTKRIHRFMDCIPPDWGAGYGNVRIGCTVENQDRADYRLPIFLSVPIKHRAVICEPLLEGLDLTAWLDGEKIDTLVAGGESGLAARECQYSWVLSLRDQCARAGVGFWFKQTGRNFIKGGRRYTILKKYQHSQARKAGISFTP